MQTSFIKSNQDVVGLILKKLSPVHLSRTALVCHDLMKILEQDKVWKQWELDVKVPKNRGWKEFIVSMIRSKLNPLLERTEKIPETLPSHVFISAELSKNETWQLHAKDDYLIPYLDTDVTVIDNSNKAKALFTLTIAAINQIILFSKTGLTCLQQAENLALKTKETFRNSEPFRLLASEYHKSNNLIKAKEMHEIAEEIDRPLQMVHGIGDTF